MGALLHLWFVLSTNRSQPMSKEASTAGCSMCGNVQLLNRFNRELPLCHILNNSYFSSLCAELDLPCRSTDESHPQKRSLHFLHLLAGSYSTNNPRSFTLYRVRAEKRLNTVSLVRTNIVEGFSWTRCVYFSSLVSESTPRKRRLCLNCSSLSDVSLRILTLA